MLPRSRSTGGSVSEPSRACSRAASLLALAPSARFRYHSALCFATSDMSPGSVQSQALTRPSSPRWKRCSSSPSNSPSKMRISAQVGQRSVSSSENSIVCTSRGRSGAFCFLRDEWERRDRRAFPAHGRIRWSAGRGTGRIHPAARVGGRLRGACGRCEDRVQQRLGRIQALRVGSR